MVSVKSLRPALENVRAMPSMENYAFYFRIARDFLNEEENTGAWESERVVYLKDYCEVQLDNLKKYRENLLCLICQQRPEFFRQGTDMYVNCKRFEDRPCDLIKKRGCMYLKIDMKEKMFGLV
jgi:hypothetical protein